MMPTGVRGLLSNTSVERRIPAALAAAAFLAGAYLASHHPIWSHWLIPAYLLWVVVAMRFPALWEFALPASLPVLNFSPWTGWIVFDEFDLLLLGALAGGFAHIALLGPTGDAQRAPPVSRRLIGIAGLLAVLGALACVRGLVAGTGMGWYANEADALNALRVGKSLLYALLLLPLVHARMALEPLAFARRLAAGMLTGLATVVAATWWERATYPGLFDFAQPYRTVALFWEMHVGGAAIDGYLAIAVPFAVWAVVAARSLPRWLAAAAFALLLEYTVLTTFSRGAYLAVSAGLVVFALLLWRRSSARIVSRGRRHANRLLIVALLIEAVAMLGSDSFMLGRLRRSAYDFGSRVAHWQAGLTLLSGPLDWSFGKGLGRLPASYAASVPERDFAGTARIETSAGTPHAVIDGPARSESLGGFFALTQRVPIDRGVNLRVRLEARADRPTRLAIGVCELHLLYEGACQRAIVVVPQGREWQHVGIDLKGPPLGTWPGLPRQRVFGMSVLDAGGHVTIGALALEDGASGNLLRNAEFTDGLARWFPANRHYFVPWHIDSLVLELLIEQGLVGLISHAALFWLAGASLLSRRSRDMPHVPVLAAALAGALVVGQVSSLLDMPRVALHLYLLAFASIQLGGVGERVTPASPEAAHPRCV